MDTARTLVIFASYPPGPDGSIIPISANSIRVAVDRIWQQHQIRMVAETATFENTGGSGPSWDVDGYKDPAGNFYVARVCTSPSDMLALATYLGYEDPQTLVAGVIAH